MRMKVNTVMQRYIDEIGASINPVIDSSILIQPGFMEWDGCILLDRERGKLPHEFIVNSVIHDRTGFEASENHLHINDFIATDIPNELLQVGLAVIKIWGTELKHKFPNVSFHLILSFDGDECIVRFHRYRTAEGAWLNIDELDKYNEGILVEEIYMDFV